MVRKGAGDVEGRCITCPSFYAAFFNAEYEDGPAFDHCSALRVVEAARNAWNDALPSSVDETKGVDGGLNIADERRYVGVTRH